MKLLSRFKKRRTSDRAQDIFAKKRPTTTVIGDNVAIIGDIRCAGNLRLAGRVTGDVTGPALVFIEKGASVRGGLTCSSTIINGSIDGQINVSGKVELGRSSRVKGDIIAGALAIERHAFITGNAISRFSLLHLFTEKRKEYAQ